LSQRITQLRNQDFFAGGEGRKQLKSRVQIFLLAPLARLKA